MENLDLFVEASPTLKIVFRLSPLWLGALLLACAGAKTPATTNLPSTYNEDLAAFRPRYGVSAKPVPVITEKQPETVAKKPVTNQPMHVNRRVDMLLDTIAMRNRAVKHATGFRIQIYVGNNRQEADAAKLFCYQTFPEIFPYMTFSSPTYRVKVGDFLTRIDAERYQDKIKDQFPGAMILQDRVEIKKGLMVK